MGVVRAPCLAAHPTGGEVVHAGLYTLIAKVVIGAEGEVYLWTDTTELFYETSHLIDAAPQLIAQGEHDERGMTAIGLQDAHAFLEQVVHERTVIGIEVTPER